MQRLLGLLLPCVVAACSGGPPRATAQAVRPGLDAPARAFVDRLLGALDRQDPVAWRGVVSARVRARIVNDPAALHDHLASWRRDVLPLASTLQTAEVAVATVGPQRVIGYSLDGGEPQVLAAVVVEDGVLHLDEN